MATKKTAVKAESGSVVLSPEFIDRVEQDAFFLELYLLGKSAHDGIYTDNSIVNFVEEFISMMPEELAPLATALRQVRAEQIAKAA